MKTATLASTPDAPATSRTALPHARLTAALGEVEACLSAVQNLDTPLVAREDASRLLELFVRLERLGAAGTTHLAPKVDDAHDLARRMGTTTGRARACLQASRDLDQAPATRGAFARGELSAEQAMEIAKTEAAVPGCETDLLARAATEPFAELRDRARRLRQAATDDATLDEQRRQARSVRSWTDALGMRRFSISMLPEYGGRLAQRLEAEAQRLWRAGQRDDSPDQRSHDALVRLLDLDPDLDPEVTVASETSAPGRPKRTRAQGRTELVIVAHADALARGHARPDEPCHLIGGPRLPVPTVKRLARDALITGLLERGTQVERIVRYGRHIPAPLKILLEVGDPPDYLGATCTGCGSRFRLQVDHIDPVANGGSTSHVNLQPLCPACHRTKTDHDRRAGLLTGRSDHGDPRGPP